MRKMDIHLWDLFFPYFILCLMLYFGVTFFSRSTAGVKKVLFVVAHPDDEAMFFAPSISHFVRQGKQVHLLCLSTGNFYHLGNIRKKELIESCQTLGIPSSNVCIIENSSLQDDPSVEWDKKISGKVILDHINTIKPDTIFTFDSVGVSGHRNHRSLYFSLQYLINDGRIQEGVDVFCLDSVSFPRQYLTVFLLDLPFSLMASDLIAVSPWRDSFKGQQACLAHWSQMEWFRILHLTFSRYMVLNSYQKISGGSTVAR